MKQSSKSGSLPSMSKELEEILNGEDDIEIRINSDELDKLIISNSLTIKHFATFRDLDLAVFILKNRKIMQRPLSSYPLLAKAQDNDLKQYQISGSGIHWPALDADISLRGLLLEETAKLVAA